MLLLEIVTSPLPLIEMPEPPALIWLLDIVTLQLPIAETASPSVVIDFPSMTISSEPVQLYGNRLGRRGRSLDTG